MSRFVAMHCGPEVDELQERHPNAFLLLCQIARRAKWQDCPVSGMRKGEAFIGDFEASGIASQMKYRTAKEALVRTGLATFKPTNKGTVATLADSRVFSLSSTGDNKPATSKQRTNNEQTTTNHTETQIHGHTEEREPALFPLRRLPASHAPNKARGTLDELKAYAVEIDMPESDGEACFHQLEGNGWTNNGKPVKGWKATIKSWSMKGYLASQKSPAAHGQHRGIHSNGTSPDGYRGPDGRIYKPAS